MYIIIL